MALDIYVMPIWRFKVGDFRSPIEAATGIRPRIVLGEGFEERPATAGWLDRWMARRQVASIRKAVEVANGTKCRWKDDGGVAYARQSQGMEPLRAYARWLDCRDRLPEFGPAPGGNFYQHPAMTYQVERPSCPHLVGHDCYNGYYLPCDFDRLVEVEPYKVYGHWPASRSVGSAVQLLRELAFVHERLQVPDDYDYPQDDPLVAVKTAYLQLRKVAKLSCRTGLPIIFWG